MGNLLDKLFRDKLSNRVFEAEASDWAAMESIIEANNAQSAIATRKQDKEKRWILIVLLLGIAAVAAFYLTYTAHQTPIQVQQAQLETNPISVSENMPTELIDQNLDSKSDQHNPIVSTDSNSSIESIRTQSRLDVENKKTVSASDEATRGEPNEYQAELINKPSFDIKLDAFTELESESPHQLISYASISNLDMQIQWKKSFLVLPAPKQNIVIQPAMNSIGFYLAYNSFSDYNSIESGLFKQFKLSDKLALSLESGYSYAGTDRIFVDEQSSSYLSFTAIDYNQELLAEQLHSLRLSLNAEYLISKIKFSIGLAYDQIIAIKARRNLMQDGVLEKSDRIWLDNSFYDKHKFRARLGFTRSINNKLGISLNYELPLNPVSRFNNTNSIGFSLKYSI